VLRIGISGAGALLWAGMYLLLTPWEFLSLAAAVIMHELGHILVLCILDGGVDALCLTGTGLRIDCLRCLKPWEEICAALAGPMFGLLWCVCAWSLGFILSCRLSAVLTIFNLLPLSYLDGGRALFGAIGLIISKKKAESICKFFDTAISVLFCGLGMYCAVKGLGAGVAVIAGWLVLFTYQKRNKALV